MVDPGRSNPPPPDCAGERVHMDDDRARARLGVRFTLWRNCGHVARQTGIPFTYVWTAAVQLLEAGHAPRDGMVIARADQLRHDHQASIERTIQRREARYERTHSENQADEDG